MRFASPFAHAYKPLPPPCIFFVRCFLLYFFPIILTLSSTQFERMLTSVQRHKGGFPTDVQFAEVNDKERLLSLDEWQSKYGHMQDEMNPRSQGEPGGNKLVRRRGQLMALAVQAQENDAMLKAKWAENRAAKKAAAMRYGF